MLEAVFSAISAILTLLQFAWNCFIRPLGKTDSQKGRLDSFYSSQAGIYDSSRRRLLHGRERMLQMVAALVSEKLRKEPGRPLVWVDVGGGTGWNLEQMEAYLPLSQFEAVYLVDLCEPLLEIARKRISEKGWKNVHVVSQDATHLQLPNAGDINLVTLSYSLSMIPNFYGVLDRIHSIVAPDAIIGAVDFYVSANTESPFEQAVGAARRRNSWFSRLFWLHWFEFDHVDLHPSRRQYLEWRFETIKTFNGRNNSFLVGIPYYIWIGCKSSNDVRRAVAAFATDSPVIQPYKTKTIKSRSSSSSDSDIAELQLESAALLAPPPEYSEKFTAFHYVKGRATRLPYKEAAVHKEFRTWIYSFVWECPSVDMQHLELSSEDTMLVITSAGDNALHYAITAQPKTIHCVDMNPCQGHLLELKLAAAAALDYTDFWKMFGDGKHTGFSKLLSLQISPYLSSHAYQFWAANDTSFDDCFYLRGYSGWPLRLVKWAITLTGNTKTVEKFCEAPTLEEQRRIWHKSLRPLLINPITQRIIANSAFLWNALGVPINQANVLLKETTMEQYVKDTFDPVAENTHLRDSNYHYHLCLARKYSQNCPPLYLSRKGFEALRADNGRLLDSFRLHTDTIINVLDSLQPESLTVFIGMDHMDWYPETPTALTAFDRDYMRRTLQALYRTLKPGGRAFWRSAGINPWYAAVFTELGFRVERISAREIGSLNPIDNVNMYASFWKAIKPIY